MCSACRASWPPTPTASCPARAISDLQPIVAQLRTIGYDGWVSLELLNPTLWQVKTAQVAELGLAALQRAARIGEQ